MTKPRKTSLSLEAKAAVLVGSVAILAALIAVLVSVWLDDWFLVTVVSLAIVTPAAIFVTHRFMEPVNRLLQALTDGVSSFRDGDFSISLGTTREDELGILVNHYNAVGDILRSERQNLFQRELLLDTVIQSTPTALVLADANDRIVYSNMAARRLFNKGRKLEGHVFLDLLRDSYPEFINAVSNETDGLFTIDADGDEEVFHVSHGRFTLNTQRHQLYLIKQMTKELNRQEVSTWKKVIRVISHELNNTLAPISSLAHSGKIIAEQTELSKLDRIFSTIEERAAFLNTFIEGYARFARLPNPQPVEIPWRDFVESLRETVPFKITAALPEISGWFDPVQMQQVLINLLKNAHESGTPDDTVEVRVNKEGPAFRIEVLDRGTGMREDVLKNALLPFYSTKQTGTGLGLPLCREIVEAHGGRLSISNRQGGGIAINILIPARSRTVASSWQ